MPKYSYPQYEIDKHFNFDIIKRALKLVACGITQRTDMRFGPWLVEVYRAEKDILRIDIQRET